MTESEFVARFLLVLVFGIVFIFVMLKAAKKSPSEIQGKHIVAKVFGGIFIALSVVMMVAAIGSIMRIEYPAESIGQPITPHSIIRPYSQSVIWGYPTVAQSKAFAAISGIFDFIGLGLYFFFFQSSDSTKGMKVWKCILFFLMFFFMQSATDLHYFDIYELFAPTLTILFMYLFSHVGKVKSKDSVTDIHSVNLGTGTSVNSKEIIISEEDVKL